MSSQTPPNHSPGRRIRLAGSDAHWSATAAETVISHFPNQPVYTCAAGISPSGIVHFGNFRDVITTLMVATALREKGKTVRVIFSWDDFDRFRKVPAGVDPSFSQYIGMPLSAVPDPEGKLPSYAAHFAGAFERSMRDLGIELEYRYQTEQYKSGRYDSMILQCLRARRQIANTLLGFMSDKAKAAKGIDPEQYCDSFYPISVYSHFTGKDNTKIVSFDDETGLLTYACLDTDKVRRVDITKERIVKLSWKIDWPMRWSMEDVVFEPGGKDHAAPGGSYDVASTIAREIFGREAPAFLGYEFVGLPNADKMSGSSGLAVSPAQLLEIYEPALLKWLYARKSATQKFDLAFDSEIFRQYDEFDRECVEWLSHNTQGASAGGNGQPRPFSEVRRQAIDLSFGGLHPLSRPVPFRQAVAFGQIVQWDASKVAEVCRDLGWNYDERSIETRLAKARSWLETYNRDEMVRLGNEVNTEYSATMSEQSASYVRQLRTSLAAGTETTVKELEVLGYSIPKDPALDDKQNSVRQRAFFKDVYQLLIGKETGPRLSTFLWAVDRETVLRLLDI